MHRSRYTGPRGDDIPICTETVTTTRGEFLCGQRHVTYRGYQACTGHVRYDRGGYVPGQDRPLLPQPRPCGADPMGGQTVCESHGGKAGQNVKAAAVRAQRSGAEALMVTLGEPINDGRDYSEVIAERVAARRGHVAWLWLRVQAVDPDALAWGITKRKTAVARERDDEERHFAGTDEGDTHEAKPNIWYAMYEDAAGKLEKLCLEAIRVGVEVRRLAMDERTADQWVRMLDGLVTALGHDPNSPETAEIVATHLALVA